MYGVAEVTGSQLYGELGDVRMFANRGSIVAFAGIDPEVNQSGNTRVQEYPATKRDHRICAKTLFQVVSTY
jgi:transposase